MALISSGTSLYLAYKGGKQSKVYLAAGLSMAAMLPFTKIFMIPINNRLLSAEQKEDAEVMASDFCHHLQSALQCAFRGVCKRMLTQCPCQCKLTKAPNWLALVLQIKQLFGKWTKLHSVRTAVSIMAFAGLTLAALHKGTK